MLKFSGEEWPGKRVASYQVLKCLGYEANQREILHTLVHKILSFSQQYIHHVMKFSSMPDTVHSFIELFH